MGRSQGSTYVIAANPSTLSIPKAHFYVPNLPQGKTITVMFENGRTLQSNAGEFTDGFGGLTRHVYQIPSF